MIIKEIKARKIRDSRGEFTIEVWIGRAKASSPNGKSTGSYETSPWHRKGIDWNIEFINNLKIDFKIKNFCDLELVERLIKKKARLQNVKDFGGNALFALESAILKALAKEQGKELWQVINSKAKKLPVPIGNVAGGGMHSMAYKDRPDFQEFLVIPNEQSFADNAAKMSDIYRKIEELSGALNKNDEGAWQVNLGNEKILKILSSYKNIRIGIDCAASTFYRHGKYNYKNKSLAKEKQIKYINDLIFSYGLFYIEDPLEENDFSGFKQIEKNGLVVGDDLTATHLNRIKKAIKMKAVNAIIAKPNQNGSLIELKKIIEFCKEKGVKTIMSHRSGETLDNALADYAFAFGADYIKTGIATKWRECKLRRMAEIERRLKKGYY